MSTAVLTRRPRGIDPGVANPTTGPCRNEPALWDIDRTGNTGVPDRRILTAAAACHLCPILAACRRALEANPPEHTCVAGGYVWAGGKPHDPNDWLDAARPNPGIARQHCARCSVPFTPRDHRQRYCRRVCATTAQDTRARERRARIAAEQGQPC